MEWIWVDSVQGLVGCLHGRQEVRMGDGEEEGRGVFEGEARGGEETRQCRAQEASHCRGCWSIDWAMFSLVFAKRQR